MTTPTRETIHSLRQWAAAVLTDAGIETPMLDARVLLGHLLHLTATQLLMADSDVVSGETADVYRTLIAQRAMGIPIAYLAGEREFMGLSFHTTPDVLVPRPDTEPLVEWGLAWLQDHPQATIADIGTGSGAIAIAVVHHAPSHWNGHLVATDISADALAIASANADRLLDAERRSRVAFRLGSLTEPLIEPVDLLLTNLPYLTPGQIGENPHLIHEPLLALDGGVDGLDLVRGVVADLPRILAPGGAVGFEIDPSQEAEVTELLARQLANHTISTVRDLAGDARHIVGVFTDC